ncbi:hypothetical protein pb186bvf_001594 [Paramecium bursaria]
MVVLIIIFYLNLIGLTKLQSEFLCNDEKSKPFDLVYKMIKNDTLQRPRVISKISYYPNQLSANQLCYLSRCLKIKSFLDILFNNELQMNNIQFKIIKIGRIQNLLKQIKSLKDGVQQLLFIVNLISRQHNQLLIRINDRGVQIDGASYSIIPLSPEIKLVKNYYQKILIVNWKNNQGSITQIELQQKIKQS